MIGFRKQNVPVSIFWPWTGLARGFICTPDVGHRSGQKKTSHQLTERQAGNAIADGAAGS